MRRARKSKRIFIIILVILAYVTPRISRAQDVPPIALPVSMSKRIDIDLSEQRLRYYYGDAEMGNILISSGTKWYPSPTGEFTIKAKYPVVRYRGSGYDFPNTKWNMLFYRNYFIHGAYWHHNFGHPMSHGCINVAYKDMEQLYNFTDVGTVVTIHQ